MSREMKYSGIPWIGDIPKDWTIENIGSCLKEVYNLNSDCSEDNALQFKMGTIISKKYGDSKYNPETLEAYNKVQAGDIVINGLNLSFDFISMRVGQVKENGVITSAYLTVRPLSHLDSSYMTYLFKGYDACKALHGMGKGLRQTLSYKEFRKYLVLHPSLEEQQKIASFLDRKCSEVDEMIGLQEQIIEELKAYKQSVITEAVTKGLNPDAPMRDSGIEWIGHIPEHWIYTKLKHLCSFHNGDRSKNYPCPDEFVDKGVPFYGADSLNDFIANVNYARFITEEKYNLMGGLKIIGGDILYTLRGSTIGKNAIVQQPNGTTASSLMGIRRKDALTNAMYLLYWLHSQNEYIQRDICINGATAPNLSAEDVKEFMLFLPPISEQQVIANYLDEKCADIDSLIQTKQSKIDSLKEYKKSIIYEYVTGKREVNE